MLSVAVITYNEERRLADCLRSVPFADEIVVLDSGSTDRTRHIAAELNARVSVRNFDNFAAQKNAAIEMTRGNWVLLLDADERVSPALAAEIRGLLSKPASFDAYYLNRLNVLFGRKMRFGANAADRQLRLMRRDYGRFEGLVHERITPRARAGRLKGELMHVSTRTVGEYFVKFALFSSLEAELAVRRGTPAGRHLLTRPFLRFVYFYVFKLGFLDGFQGFVFHVLGAYYEFVRRAKHWERVNIR